MSLIDQAVGSFVVEAGELLSELETVLLELEVEPSNADLMARAFRAMHTLKGSGAMFGFQTVASFTHELETVFDEVRKGKLAVSPPLISLALECRDLIRGLIAGEERSTQANRQRLMEALRSYLPKNSVRQTGSRPNGDGPGDDRLLPEKTYRVLFRPEADLFRNGTNPLGLLNELAQLGRSRVIAQTRAVPDLEEIDPELCYLAWDILVTTRKSVEVIRGVFIFVEDHGTLRIDLVDDGEDQATGDSKKLGEILEERGDISADMLKASLAQQKRVGELLVKNGSVSRETVAAAVLEQLTVREARAGREAQRQPDPTSTIRVAAEKLDDLVDLVGELVIAQARLGQMATLRDDGELLSVGEEMDRLTSALRDNTLSIRMVPIGTTFSRFKRLVRDLSAELGKEIELQTEGAETELDKTVIERLADPLVHLIRNSCDHGIEKPAQRRAAGKPTRGTIHLSAYHTGPNVFIEIQDDGAGLDVEAIRSKAVERGFLAAEATPSRQDLLKLIFQAGFSTARTVSNVSGRGVGMDVVKRSIDAIRGSVEVESTQGQGTTVRLRLPLTLAIIEGLMVSLADARYVLPMSLVEECVELTRQDVAHSHGNNLAMVRGELVPYLRLREWFSVTGTRPAIEQIVIVSVEGQRVGFVVDSVVGQHQTVIKSLGRMYRHIEGLSGATILGDGTVALIVDVPALIRDSSEALQAAS